MAGEQPRKRNVVCIKDRLQRIFLGEFYLPKLFNGISNFQQIYLLIGFFEYCFRARGDETRIWNFFHRGNININNNNSRRTTLTTNSPKQQKNFHLRNVNLDRVFLFIINWWCGLVGQQEPKKGDT